MKHNLTNLTQVEQVTGLTPQQEQAALLLASGESVTDVASKINVTRATIYLWLQKVGFKCFYNQQCQIIKDNIRNGLCGLYGDALQALKDTLKSDNEPARLKAAMYILGKIEMIDTSQQDPVEEIKKLCTTSAFPDVDDYISFDSKKYDALLLENGLSE